MEVLGRIRDYEEPSRLLDEAILHAALFSVGSGAVPALSTDVRAVFALAEQTLDCMAVDIEVAVRYVAGKRYGRAEICGQRGMGECRSTNEAMALSGALLAALINGMGKKS